MPFHYAIRPWGKGSSCDDFAIQQFSYVTQLLNSPPLSENRDFGLPKVATHSFIIVATMTSLCLEDTIDAALNLVKASIK